MKFIKLLKAIVAMGLSGALFAPSAHAITIEQLYTLSHEKQWAFLIDTINEMCAKLRSETDAWGQRKSPELLKKQTDFAEFMWALFNEKDGKGSQIKFVELNSFIYSCSLRDRSLSVESVIVIFTTKRYKEKLALEAAGAASQIPVDLPSKPSLE